jgi:hypothetical protein
MKIWLVLLCLLAPRVALADPDLDRPVTLRDAGDPVRQWIVFPDTTRPATYYRLPEAFGIRRFPDGTPMTEPVRLADGSMALTSLWGPADPSRDLAVLEAAFRLYAGAEAILITPAPLSQRVDWDPELTEDLGVNVEEDGDATVFLVPVDSERAFLQRLRDGLGFTNLLRMVLVFEHPVRGAVQMSYTPAFNLGGHRLCDVKPERFPCVR